MRTSWFKTSSPLHHIPSNHHHQLSLSLSLTQALAMSQTQFNKGDQVEVAEPGHGSTGPYYPATVLRSVAKDKAHIFVQYQTLATHKPDDGPDGSKPLTEIVELGNVRPMPPKKNSFFKVGDDVDAYREKGWFRGTVMDIFENSRYLVVLRGGQGREFECEQWNLRLHRDWDDGSWVPPFQEEEISSEMVVKSRKVRLKIKCGRKTLGANFENGTWVEVSSEEEGYEDAWYIAKIVDSLGNDKFLVEYQHLVTDDGAQPLREEAYASYIRPCPPPLLSVAQLNLLQKVDAWYNEGWWEGVIYKVLCRGSKYVVYFSSTNEQLEFKRSDLRPHLDWINGQWTHASMVTGHGNDHQGFRWQEERAK